MLTTLGQTVPSTDSNREGPIADGGHHRVPKNHLLIFSSFLAIWENVEWPRFFGPPCRP